MRKDSWGVKMNFYNNTYIQCTYLHLSVALYDFHPHIIIFDPTFLYEEKIYNPPYSTFPSPLVTHSLLLTLPTISPSHLLHIWLASVGHFELVALQMLFLKF